MSDEATRQLIDRLPDGPPRSKPEPFADIIAALRKKRWTYREIAAFLQEHDQLKVAHTTVIDFIKARGRRARSNVPTIPAATQTPVVYYPGPLNAVETPSKVKSPAKLSTEEIERRRSILQALRNKPALEPKPAVLQEFHYDENKPLTIDRTTKD